jgi:hypothetical protein
MKDFVDNLWLSSDKDSTKHVKKKKKKKKTPSKRLFSPQCGESGHSESRFFTNFLGVLFGEFTITTV